MENIQGRESAGLPKAAPPRSPKGSQKTVVRFFKKNGAGFVFALPVTLGLLFFTAYPLLASLYYSFFEVYTVIRPPEGFSLTFNLTKMFSDLEWVKAVANTGIYTLISVPMFMVLSFSLALFLNLKVKGIGVYRMLMYMPCVMSAVVSGIAWRSLIDVDYGWFNRIIRMIGLEPYSFLNEAATSMPTLIFVGLWGLGGPMILWLSQLKNISAELYEAASLDGASAWQKFRYITLPALRPTFNYVVIFGLIGSFQVFDQVFILTSGGPARSTETIVYRIYTEAFGNGKLGYASALSYVLLIMTLIVGLIQLYTNNKHEKEEIA